MFKETVLQIEGENVSAIDVAQHLDELHGNLMLQKEDQYLAPLVKSERKKLMSDDESGFDDVTFRETVDEFFGKLDIAAICIFQIFIDFSVLSRIQTPPAITSVSGVNSTSRSKSIHGFHFIANHASLVPN